jgi:hypothetical protein
MRRNSLLLIISALLAAACSRAPAKVTEPLPVKQESNVPAVPLSVINLADIGSIAPKGRVQDRDFHNLAVVTSLIQHGKDAVPYLISNLDNETKIDGHVMDYWSEVRVADVALIILCDFFSDSSGQPTLPKVGWDEFLEREPQTDLTGEQLLRNYVSKHGRKAIKDRWQALWLEYRDRLFWDESERCFKVTRQ